MADVAIPMPSDSAMHLPPVCVGWTFTVAEAWTWGRGEDELVGHRSASPWDDDPRRPSHADKRRAWRRELLAEEIRAVLRPGVTEQEIVAAAERLLNLAGLTYWPSSDGTAAVLFPPIRGAAPPAEEVSCSKVPIPSPAKT